MENKTLPNDPDCEKIVLGTIIQNRNAINEVREILSEDCFYNYLHRDIYKAILSIVNRGDRADMISVPAELNKMNISFQIYDFALIAGCSTYDVYQHAARLHDLAKRRKFYEIGQYLVSNSFNESEDIVDVLSGANEMLSGIFKDSSSSVTVISDAVHSVYEQMNKNLSATAELTGTPTGFSEIDRKSGGLQKSNLIIIAAETSMGKTSLAVSMMRNAALYGGKCAMYSMEMKKEEVTARLMSIESGVPANEILYSKLGSSQIEHIDKTVSKVMEMGIYFDDRSTSSIDMIIASIRSMKLKYNIDGAIIDYLQILNVNMKGSNKEAQMGEVARRLKNLAKELDVWIMALSQLNRDSQNPIPSLNRLRDSGQIAEAADVVMLIYRPEIHSKSYPEPFQSQPTQGTAMIDIAKGRNIGLLKLICGFDKFTTHFYEKENMMFVNNPTQTDDENPF